MKNGRAQAAVNKYWCAGMVGGLLILDGLAIVLCTSDVIRFVYNGHSLASAISVGTEKLVEGEELWTTIAVLTFFVVALPMVFALISSVAGLGNRWPRLFQARGHGLLATHLLASLILATFTTVAMAMEVLSGFENNDIVRYSFLSLWLSIVFLGKPLWISYVSPIIRKFFIRLPHEKEDIKKVAIEVVTEESLGPERVA
jgi:hypothetical protein